ncbi:aldehyde dehydrogenase family protein [Dactylosporangium salmoneum]|uniref:Aldehyde dehydrogenase n=1 Tax=Dactylosporangium salmoneum TaxID=53361 RepID=A0ABN3H8F4_9ACTN
MSYDKFFIGGEWVEPAGDEVEDITNPATEEVVARIPAATVKDAERALLAARQAFDEGPWPHLSAARRADGVRRLAAAFDSRIEAMTQAYTAESGAPIGASRAMHERVAGYWTRAADLATYFSFEELRGWPNGDGRARRILAPAGVGVGIQPFNGPVSTAAQKAGAALVAGCTMVLKPAIENPTTMMLLAEAVAEANLPPGVLNIVPGRAEVGAYLAGSPLTDKVSFTGSTAAGTAIMQACAPNITRMALELGGKSAALVTEDVDLEAIAAPLMWGAIRSCGQICYATTRVLVARPQYEEMVQRLADAMRQVRIGDPLDPATELGPLISSRQRDRVQAIVDGAVAEGVRLVTGGRRPATQTRGWYFEPTLFAAESNAVSVAQQEIFGPVLTVVPYGGIDEAVALANDSDYGLGGAVFCRDVDRAVAIARRIRSGHVYINTTGAFTGQPFGGFKKSGFDREGGPEGLLSWLEPQMIFS